MVVEIFQIYVVWDGWVDGSVSEEMMVMLSRMCARLRHFILSTFGNEEVYKTVVSSLVPSLSVKV